MIWAALDTLLDRLAELDRRYDVAAWAIAGVAILALVLVGVRGGDCVGVAVAPGIQVCAPEALRVR